MSNYIKASADCDGEQECRKDSALVVSKNNKLYHVFRFMQKAYGNDIGRFLNSFNNVLALSAVSDRVNNKKLKFALKMLRYGVPAFLHGAELYSNLKSYINELKEQQSPTYHKRIAKICKLLDIKETEVGKTTLYENGFVCDYDLIHWLTLRPNTKKIKILGLFSIDSLAELDSIDNLEKTKTTIAIIFEYEGEKFLIESVIINMGASNFIDNTQIIGSFLTEERLDELRQVFTCEFIESLSISKNTLFFNQQSNIKCTPRVTVEEDINQYDVGTFIKEIRQVLDCGRKRAYVFVSRPGTGKSTILRKIEEVMTDTVIFHLSPEDLGFDRQILDRFAIMGKIKKCIVIIEDLDACGMHEKNAKTGVFLDAIDDVNNKLNMVILVTVNDTSRVHFSVINRPGRFDRIIEIKPPQTIEEIYAIMVSKAKKLKKSYSQGSCFSILPFSSISEDAQEDDTMTIDLALLDACLQSEYTQAEIADAVTEQIFLNASIDVKDGKLTWEEAYSDFNAYFKKAIESHESTRTALRNCNFKNEDPMDDDTKNCQAGIPGTITARNYPAQFELEEGE